jgi:putative endonuclease
MYFTYILHSIHLNKFYIGSTSKLEDRLQKHLFNHKGFTAKAKDWQLVYFEQFYSKDDALFRERQIKNWKSSKKIRELISKSD